MIARLKQERGQAGLNKMFNICIPEVAYHG
jgi:hypothetical protein